MKKITILALHLGYGGIEKAVATLANLLAEDYDVEIISTYKLYSEPPFKLDERIHVKYLIEDLQPNKKELSFYHKTKNYSQFFKELRKSVKILYLRKKLMVEAIKNLDTDVVISTRILHNKWLSKYGKGNYKKIAWEHNHHNNNEKYIHDLVSSCKNLDYLVTVSRELAHFYEPYLGKKVKCIQNCLDVIPQKASKLEDRNVIAVGRLSEEKGFADLLRLYKKVSIKHPDWTLNIIGDGFERNNLLEEKDRLKLGDSVIFHGYQDKDYINDMLQKSSIYVMTSYTESFGLVLVEAFSYGVPCLSYTSAQGANEIITDGYNGYLINNRNEEEMVKKIDLLITDEKLRKTLGKNARATSLLYDGNRALKEWKRL